jgi:hypothetical protein
MGESPADRRGSRDAIGATGQTLGVASTPSATPSAAPALAPATASIVGFSLDLLRDKGRSQWLKYCGHVGLLHSRESRHALDLVWDPGAPHALRELCLTLAVANEDAVRRP